jgi:hypothetical protein
MLLEKLHEEWAKDSEMKFDQPDKLIREVPLLHSKWWQYYTTERQRYMVIKQDYDELRRAKFEWYLGRMSDEEREKRQWPHQHLRIVRQEVETYLNSDSELLPFHGKLETQELKLKFIEDCIKSINSRGYLIRNYIDWLRFSQGA